MNTAQSYTQRKYRQLMSGERFRSFCISYKDSDLWIGVDSDSYRSQIRFDAFEYVVQLRKEIEAYIEKQPEFLTSLIPVQVDDNAPAIIQTLAKAGYVAHVGPMAAVAGGVAQFAAEFLSSKFDMKEVVIENGGDLFLKIEQPAIVSVFAGQSPLSDIIGIKVAPEYSPVGVCCSSATVGDSLSFGAADAVVIACKDAALADAYATSFCNKILTKNDLELVIEEIKNHEQILSAVLIKGEKMAARGKFGIEILAKKER